MSNAGPDKNAADPSGGRQNVTPQTTRPNLSDIILPGLIYAFCIVISLLAMTFEKAPDIFVGKGMQPRSFPLFLMVLVAILNTILLRQTFRNPPGKRNAVPYQTWLTMALMVLFFLITTYADMILALMVIIFSMALLWGERRIWLALLLAVVTPTTILLFFDLVLEVRFPRGWITNLYYK